MCSVHFIYFQSESGVSVKDWEEDVTKSTLIALNDMRIKFPGKSDEEADYLLDKVDSMICRHRI
jgi:tubulin polyglutamylase TTLL7